MRLLHLLNALVNTNVDKQRSFKIHFALETYPGAAPIQIGLQTVMISSCTSNQNQPFYMGKNKYILYLQLFWASGNIEFLPVKTCSLTYADPLQPLLNLNVRDHSLKYLLVILPYLLPTASFSSRY